MYAANITVDILDIPDLQIERDDFFNFSSVSTYKLTYLVNARVVYLIEQILVAFTSLTGSLSELDH